MSIFKIEKLWSVQKHQESMQMSIVDGIAGTQAYLNQTKSASDYRFANLATSLGFGIVKQWGQSFACQSLFFSVSRNGMDGDNAERRGGNSLPRYFLGFKSKLCGATI